MGIQCDDCGKVLQSRKAYAGHMLLAHGKRVGFMAEFDRLVQQVNAMQATIAGMEPVVAWLNSNMERIRPLGPVAERLVEGSNTPVRVWPLFCVALPDKPSGPVSLGCKRAVSRDWGKCPRVPK